MDEIKKILIATDGSDYTKAAVKKGLSLAKMLGAEAIAVYVVDIRSFAGTSMYEMAYAYVDTMRDNGDEVLKELDKQAESMGIKIKTLKREGVPADEIISLAEETDADLIVIGSLGLSALEKLLLGSVAEKVIRHAPCPVLVVRNKVTRKEMKK